MWRGLHTTMPRCCCCATGGEPRGGSGQSEPRPVGVLGAGADLGDGDEDLAVGAAQDVGELLVEVGALGVPAQQRKQHGERGEDGCTASVHGPPGARGRAVVDRSHRCTVFQGSSLFPGPRCHGRARAPRERSRQPRPGPRGGVPARVRPAPGRPPGNMRRGRVQPGRVPHRLPPQPLHRARRTARGAPSCTTGAALPDPRSRAPLPCTVGTMSATPAITAEASAETPSATRG